MNKSSVLLLVGLALIPLSVARAQVAGSTLVAVSASEMREVALGWSAKRQVLGQAVYNDKNERIGAVDDIIIAPDKAVSYAIINVGGFLSVAKHNVAVPVSQLKQEQGKFVLAGATRDALKASAPFEYAPSSEQ